MTDPRLAELERRRLSDFVLFHVKQLQTSKVEICEISPTATVAQQCARFNVLGWNSAIDFAIEQARIVFGEGTDGKSQLGRAEPGGCEQHDPDMQNLRAGAPDAA